MLALPFRVGAPTGSQRQHLQSGCLDAHTRRRRDDPRASPRSERLGYLMYCLDLIYRKAAGSVCCGLGFCLSDAETRSLPHLCRPAYVG